MAKLPDDARAWLDAEQLPDAPTGRFNQRVDPARLLDPSSGAVWGGLMLPDSLPLVSDGGGVRAQPAEHEEEPHQSDEPEFVEKEGWYHGNAPTDSGEMRAL